jgi:tetratricopeptide (TPR) repeat protein
MPTFSEDEIRRRFSLSTDFNEIFDAFEAAIAQRLDDVEIYRLLFWNHSLTPDELCLFGQKLVQEFPHIAYDVYMWLANVFEVTYSMYDNYDLAIEYYKKAASVRPAEPDPYLDAADCYEPDLNIPPVGVLIDFLKDGVQHVANPRNVYQRLSYFYQIVGDSSLSEYYRRKAEEHGMPRRQGPSHGGHAGMPSEEEDVPPPSPS